MLSGMACKHMQSAYKRLKKSLQQEWELVQWITPYIGDAFGPLQIALRDTFAPDFLQGVGEGTRGQGVTLLPMKQAVFALPDPTNTARENWRASCVIKGHLVAVLRGQEKFRMEDHSAYMIQGRVQVRKRTVLRSQEALEETLEGSLVQVSCRLRRTTKTGAWLMVHLSTLNKT